MNIHFNKRTFRLFLITFTIGVSFCLLLTLIFTTQAIKKLKNFEVAAAADQADKALFIVKPLSTITFHLIPDIELWREALTLMAENEQTVTSLQDIPATLFLSSADAQEATSSQTAKTALSKLAHASDRLQKMSRYCQQRIVLPTEEMCTTINEADQLAIDAVAVGRWLVEEDPTLIVLFQNSEELRATGGFMGSYAKVSFIDGQISDLKIEDIYQPDGQFTGYVEAPAGVKEYLSSGQGLRLPDANWHPDFPTSAQTILNYFALGKEQSIDGVIAINSDLVEKLLTVTGDIYLPDYSVTVTSANFTTLARADRGQFFPGSQQKTNFLSHFLNVLKVKLVTLQPAQQQQLLSLLRQSLVDKTIQLYSGREDIQKIWTQYGVSGALQSPNQRSPVIYLVESNVGINKANRDLTRTVDLDVNSPQVTVSINFHNQNSDLGYVNYQRLIVPIEWSIDPMDLAPHIWVDGHGVREVDVEIITNARGQQFRQLGWLITVPAHSTASTNVTLTTPPPTATSEVLTILKQPGLPATPYTLTTAGRTETMILEKDTVVTLSP